MIKKKLKSILHLLRIRQYYKNGLIFVGVFFSENLLDFTLYLSLILGFIMLCCTSSINYIINDMLDMEKDRSHGEKLSKKPLASGELSMTFAVILLLVLMSIPLFILIFFVRNLNFVIILLLILITGQSYNFVFKKVPFVDLIVLSLGYLWRALSGCVLIEQYVSAWLFLAIFEIAMFLVIAKRKGDLIFLGDNEKASEHKKIYDYYSISFLDQMLQIVAGSIFITYALYLILKFNLFSSDSLIIGEYIAILTIPILLYILFRYMYLTSVKPDLARSTEKALMDPGILIAGLIMGGILFYFFYFDQVIELFNSTF